MRNTTVKRPGRLDLEERTERARRQALPPPRWCDPVGDLPFSFHREAAYGPHELAVVVDRSQRARRVVADALVVGVERGAVGRIRSRERCHLDRPRIALPDEE